MAATKPLLLTPLAIHGVTLPNRIAVSPMAMYRAQDGFPVPFHLVHYGKFAMGGAGLVYVEEAAVTRTGRITNGCLGLWDDAHADRSRTGAWSNACRPMPITLIRSSGDR